MKFSDKLLLAGSFIAIVVILIFCEQWFHPKEFAHFSSEMLSGVQLFLLILGSLIVALLAGATVLGVWLAIVKISNERGVVRSTGKSQAVAIRKYDVEEEIVQLSPSLVQADPRQSLAQFKQMAQIYSLMLREARHQSIDGAQEEPVDAQIAVPETPAALASPGEEVLNLSKEYQVPADDFLSGRKLIVGISGSGKSNTIGVYSEELGRLLVPFVLADTEDEYRPLCQRQWLPYGILAGATGAYSVSVEDASQFGRYVLETNKQVIFNLQSYDLVEAAKVMIGIIAGMRTWQEERENERRIPCDFILEEAVTWLPQYVTESPLKTKDPQTFALLQNTFFNDLVRKGRKRGLGITLVCQKIAELDNRAMQSDGKLLHRQTEEADLERYRKMGISREETLSLQNGEAFLYTGRVSKLRLQIRRRFSPHGANTPGLEQLRKHQSIARNSGEIWGNFGHHPEISQEHPSAFAPSTEELGGNGAKISPLPSSQYSAESSEISEDLKAKILELYQRKVRRIAIRDQLGLNGNEYWIIRDVCNEYDRKLAAEEE